MAVDSRSHSPAPQRGPAANVMTLQTLNTKLSQPLRVTPASARSTSSVAASPYANSLQASPLVLPIYDGQPRLGSPGPLELPEAVVQHEFPHRSTSIRDSCSVKNSPGLIRKLSVSAKASVQSTGQRLRRKASSTNQRRDQSSGPITRRRSDSKTASSVGGSAADLSGRDEPLTDYGEDFPPLDLNDTKSPTSEPFSSSSTNPEGDAPTVPQQLIQGSELTKVTKGRRNIQRFFLNIEGSRVSWNGKVRQKYFWVDDIRGFRTGQDAIGNRQDVKDAETDRWLNVLYADPDRAKSTKTLSLIAPSRDELKLWLDTLEALSKHREELMTSMRESVERESIVKAHWDSELAIQKNPSSQNIRDHGLQLSSIESLCRRLHIHSPRSTIQEFFALSDVRKVGELDFEQFKSFLRRLKERRDLREIFDELRGDESRGLSKDQFLLFLEASQGVKVTENVQHWDSQFQRCLRPSHGVRNADVTAAEDAQGYMGFEAFSFFMLSKACNIYSLHNSRPYFDRPLNEYFIASSHNTYLNGRQAFGESSTEAYIAALRHGCRCVEIDCWNGPSQEPIVTHGRTRTSSISFSDCISVINRYAFDYSSYPLILSLEVHCDSEQQNRMIRHMQQILGTKLLLHPITSEANKLPSPEELKNKILVKVKSHHNSVESDSSGEPPNVGRQRSVSSPARQLTTWSSTNLPPVPPLPSPLSVSPPTSHADLLNSPHERSVTTTSISSVDGDSDSLDSDVPVPTTPSKKVKSTNITPGLAALGVYLQGYKYHNFQAPEASSFNHIFSLDESKANAVCNFAETKALFEDHNISYMSRVYPRGTRLDSSNFDPNTFWRRGVQMVALNWQTYDQYQQMNQAMFAAGIDAYGYVLKPEYMRRPRQKDGPKDSQFTHRSKLARKTVKFSVEVISAQQLPRLPDMSKTGSINPFVEVQMFSADDRTQGVATGKGGEESSSRGGYSGIGLPYSRRTKIVPENGYNPQFRDLFDISLETKYPELVFVRFVVWHSPDARYAGKGCKQLAVFTAKLSSLQAGYRHLPLYNGSGEEFIFSTLFCRIKKSDPVLFPRSMQDGTERPAGRTLIKNVFTRNLSGERARERSASLEKPEAW